jgi:hypothetical protein
VPSDKNQINRIIFLHLNSKQNVGQWKLSIQ